jgi:hypothetical protein
VTVPAVPSTRPLASRLDHLVVVADNLAQAAAWCRATFGVSPGPGGRHALMGTHNLLLPIGGPAWPQAYLEMIAIDPDAAPPADGRARWFGMDDPRLQAAVRASPQLVHLVAQTRPLSDALAALAALGENPGEAVPASRPVPGGELRWRISLRKDGQPQHQGALPTLIEWDGPHPSTAMPPVGLRLDSLRLASAEARALAAAVSAIGLEGVEVRPGGAGDETAPGLLARFTTPRGEVQLASPRL